MDLSRGKAVVKTDLAISIPIGTYARIGTKVLFFASVLRILFVRIRIDLQFVVCCAASRSVVNYDCQGNVEVGSFSHTQTDLQGMSIPHEHEFCCDFHFLCLLLFLFFAAIQHVKTALTS